MSDRVKLPRGVAEELTAMKQHESYPISLVIDIFNGVSVGAKGDLAKYFDSDRSRRIEIIMKALVNGYEVEETPEDKVRDYYLSYEREQHWTACNHIKSVLELLGITIEGVNA